MKIRQRRARKKEKEDKLAREKERSEIRDVRFRLSRRGNLTRRQSNCSISFVLYFPFFFSSLFFFQRGSCAIDLQRRTSSRATSIDINPSNRNGGSRNEPSDCSRDSRARRGVTTQKHPAERERQTDRGGDRPSGSQTAGNDPARARQVASRARARRHTEIAVSLIVVRN